jgi:CDP-glucose 4,6-dehydratase
VEREGGTLEGMGVNTNFWKDKKVLVTGHTGFKGSWLSIWLEEMGSKVVGISLDAPTVPSIFKKAGIEKDIISLHQDIRDGERLKALFEEYQPEIVFHLAAQPLVRHSYKNPVETYETNVMGTLHVLEAIRSCKSVKSAVLITTDKCYKNKEWDWGYREIDSMGGHDPYSSSKACCELLIESYRDSYYPKENYSQHKVAIASVRAGNVIGGGDWAKDRLIPDIIRAIQNDTPVGVRYPEAIRPWQHVLEPLYGYLKLAEYLFKDGSEYAEAWNFGPRDEDVKSVGWIVNQVIDLWGEGQSTIDCGKNPHEAGLLKLDCSKVHARLNWRPVWNLEKTLYKIVEWHKQEAETKNSVKDICVKQIYDYMNMQNKKNRLL